MKYFIITVDTEGDNLWEYKMGETIGTRNAEYIPRFQALCEKYDFKPVYLTNYEMAQSDVFIKEAREWLQKGTCEIGVHLHAWNNPPFHQLDGPYNGNPYLIEYPVEVMREKFKVVYDLIVKNFGINPVSHRSGRWAMDERYFKILEEFGIKVDCSYTPGIDWSSFNGITKGGSDYRTVKNTSHYIGNVYEVPATVRNFRNCLNGSLKHRIKSMIKGEDVWLRPALSSLSVMKKLMTNVNREKDTDVLEFMIHSSELMPNGSPYFKTEHDINKLYQTMEEVFAYAKKLQYEGIALNEYANL